ncbi:MAG: hypothetical protein A2Y88_06790 [Chloroflexi bacterium RBG_13_48_10]|nr:MAG: hypothetical protein A2Y88_06790 [Chloroflexi bacterium RBG_13_48_10]
MQVVDAVRDVARSKGKVGADGVRVVAQMEGEVGAVVAISLDRDQVATAFAPNVVIRYCMLLVNDAMIKPVLNAVQG